ncbi:TnsA endonuclease N-terminal domain-containing protein [Chamaesiphon minutus]|uniref:Integrase family protein n=1 Tax=Chamaesiphon minutus (strain ATCC 27169 / PCC 6605) TaxID=1173020 RepID=K9UF00_CHAP6|nr:TnsA endonuclease N-terminal domain-containing protein [Chamaesiphon minutus]AFY91354.1 integrase family protein [Chamaesiphon minutus PCC 6605]AFY93006.1 integrase family protein [Chamaesiphon minutus PCC 6605]AFY93083.1 integrase family protein [Chamaesiphon minutus PCC 6605]
MNPREFERWCQTLNLPPAAIEAIAKIRSAPPSRRVQGRASNVSGTYPSQKMGLTIQFESHKVELWAIYLMEHDPTVLEFYDQPSCFKIQYTNKSGRKIGHYHTPDFFVLGTKSAAWVEWKTEAELEKLSEKYPTRYLQAADGSWRCPPGEAYASPLGLEYHVRTDASLDPIYIQNLIFLEDYLGFKTDSNPSIQALVKERVKTAPGITLAALLASSPQISANDVYVMIVLDQLYIALLDVPLVQHERVRLYPDRQTYDTYRESSQHQKDLTIADTAPPTLVANTRLRWDGRLWTLVNLGETTTTLLPEIGQPLQISSAFFYQLLDGGAINFPETEGATNPAVIALMEGASPSDLRTANQRFGAVMAEREQGAAGQSDVSKRTLYRWLKQLKEAELKYGCGYVGLLPKTQARGNRTTKAPNVSSELLNTFITGQFETPTQAPAASVYRAYQRACEQQGIPSLSRCTFYARLQQRPIHEQTEKRKGSKAAYRHQPWYWELTYSTPRHGDRPLGIVHIDHTQLDLELRSATTGRLLGRPWLTLMVDAYSRRILTIYLTFDPPSYRSCMMAIRICVQRFGRFPQAIVVDGGKEFHSVYFDTLLARYHCTKKTRPGAKPRFGSVIERLFGTTNTQLIFNLSGNTQATKQVREITKAVNPKQHALWTLGDLYAYLVEYAYVVYDQNEHPALSMSPQSAYEQGEMNAGERLHRRIAYDEDFILATHPSPRSGQALVQPGKGIKLNYLYYWSDAFRHPEVERTKVSVRYDPFDLGVAYAYVQGRWVKCISQYYSIFSGRSERELLLASLEIKQQAKLTQTNTTISAKRLADFLSNVTAHEALMLQRLRDLEGQNVLNTLGQRASSAPQSQPQPQTEPLAPNSLQTLAPTQPSPALVLDLSQIPLFEEYR